MIFRKQFSFQRSAFSLFTKAGEKYANIKNRPVFVFELRSEIGAGLVPANQFFQLGADCFRDRDATR